MTGKLRIYTIEHSTISPSDFLELLTKNKIEVLVDVRSMPYSKIAPQFNKEMLKSLLTKNNVRYGYMGDLLGARHTETDVLTDNGQVDFKKVANLPSFKQGISRLIKGMEKYRIALMCSERDPMTCHRFGLISKVLTDNNVEVLHITTDRVIPEKELEDKLIKIYYKQIDCFFSAESPREQAYRLLNKKIGYEHEE